jgi:uncharacterized OsmC-like protein
METLTPYLQRKREALERQMQMRGLDPATIEPTEIRAVAAVGPNSGVRRIQIRDHQILTDSLADGAGDDLGPSSPELQLGVLASCLAHVFVTHAAAFDVPLSVVEVEVEARIDDRARMPGHERTPIYPHHISYIVRVESNAPQETIADLHEIVEKNCPILNLLKEPQVVSGKLVHNGHPGE